MIRGRFGNTSGRPYIEAFLHFPTLGVEGAVSFLVDTGADSTVLMPLDAFRLKIDHSRLTDTDDSIGIGGISVDYVIAAVLVIPDENLAHGYELTLRIPQYNADLRSVPSLLGRDVLNRWQMNYNPTAGELTAAVVSSDWQLPLP